MTRDELIKKLDDLDNDIDGDERWYLEKVADFILANWKEFIPEGYKYISGMLGKDYGNRDSIGSLLLEEIVNFNIGKQAILLIEDK